MLSQAQADNCCAASAQGRDSSTAGSTVFSSSAIALVPLDAMVAPAPASASQGWRALVPLRVSSTPRHLLLSVLIV
jgi:hypothetical protein